MFILENIRDQGINALEVRRIKRRENGVLVNTPSLIVAISGTQCPTKINFSFIRVATRHYYPNSMQCYKCWAFGNTSGWCKATKSSCGTCGGHHPITENRICDREFFCKSCKIPGHRSNSRTGPVYTQESAIQRVKVDQGISYLQAHEAVSRTGGINQTSYASVAKTTTVNVASSEPISVAASNTAPSTRPAVTPISSSLAEELRELKEQVGQLIRTVNHKDRIIMQLLAKLEERELSTNRSNKELTTELANLTRLVHNLGNRTQKTRNQNDSAQQPTYHSPPNRPEEPEIPTDWLDSQSRTMLETIQQQLQTLEEEMDSVKNLQKAVIENANKQPTDANKKRKRHKNSGPENNAGRSSRSSSSSSEPTPKALITEGNKTLVQWKEGADSGDETEHDTTIVNIPSSSDNSPNTTPTKKQLHPINSTAGREPKTPAKRAAPTVPDRPQRAPTKSRTPAKGKRSPEADQQYSTSTTESG